MSVAVTRRVFTKIGAAVVVGLFSLCHEGGAAGPDWHVGLAQACITPDHPVWMQGYMEKARQTVYHDAHRPSHLLLPVIRFE